MDFRIDNLGMLLGLAALAIPVVIHLLQRRRFEIVDWGAMQFLPENVSVRRRRWLDEIVLMLLRMAMIALIVVALAAPYSTGGWLAPLEDHATRDVVLVLDGSYSMDLRLPGQPSPWQDAIRWAGERIGQSARGERFALMIARQSAAPGPTHLLGDAADVLAKLERMPAPSGNPDMPKALADAWRFLQSQSQANEKEIVVLTDRQLFGWADPETLSALENLGNQWRDAARSARNEGLTVPSVRVVPVGPALPAALPNYALAPITASRHVARVGQKVTLRSALHMDGLGSYVRPRRVKVSVDGNDVQELAIPEKAELTQGQIPLSFERRFDKTGQHVVTVTVEADPSQDVLAGDNEQSIIVEVVKELPILLVDGDRKLSAESSSFYLQRALEQAGQASGGVVAVPYSQLTPAMIEPETGKPTVIVLADVPRLDQASLDAIERFVAEGGGLFVAAGERAGHDPTFWNDRVWLPAKLDQVGAAKDGVQPDPRTFQHPALEMLRKSEGALTQVRFSKWWKVSAAESSSVVALLNNGDPLLVERPFKRGRVVLSTVPLDRRWESTLPGAWEFPVLVHEIVDYLAGSRVGNEGPPPVDLRESNLTRCSETDWHKVEDRIPIVRHTETSAGMPESGREELWWMLLIAVVGMLCAEVWMTRRMVYR